MIEAAGEGVVVYLRQEGRGIGLINKLRAYSLQDGGLDTVEANERLGFAADLRNYGVGAQILSDLGVHRLRLITNNPRKIAGLGGYGLTVEDRIPLIMDPGDHNAAYLQAKRLKLGHLMETDAQAESGGPHGLSAVLAWCGEADSHTVAERMEGLRHWARQRGLLLEEEEHPRLLALLDQPRLALLLTAAPHGQLSAADLAGPLMVMARWERTQAVGLLLTPDLRRRSHPSADLEPEARVLADLQESHDSARCPLLNLTPGAFIRWRA
jgi:3,4-dihydroxy 2-butanone 4-phosphate synthase/GTP cyclohydrolase II